MIKRTLYTIAFNKVWGRQMRFIVGPRQAGKTTIAKAKLSEEKDSNLYYLWDSQEIRKRYRQSELFFSTDMPLSQNKKHWLCFDEIHKMPKWKNIVKSIFDQTEKNFFFIVTGSSKLNITKSAGDSLSGRYFNFTLFPLTLREVLEKPEINIKHYTVNPIKMLNMILSLKNQDNFKHLEDLFKYSGFPEPFLSKSLLFCSKWQESYIDKVINEDIGLLTRIEDREKLFSLYNLIPEFVGSILSENSISKHLGSNPVSVKNYLKRLADFWLLFKICPYSKNIKRAIRKSSKWYLFDWTKVNNEAAKFENYVAVELFALTKYISNMTNDKYSLSFVRDKNKNEVDFLILRNHSPWLMIESKLSDRPLDKHLYSLSEQLGNIPILQLCKEPNINIQIKKNVFKFSADRFFSF